LLLPLLALDTKAARSVEYRLDPEASQLIVRVFKAGIGKALAHDHVVRAGEVRGVVRFDPEHAETAVIEISVEAASLRVDEPDLRRQHGLDPLGEDTRREIQETMEGSEQLAIAEHPQIRFVSTAASPVSKDRFEIAGDFTLHGMTRSLTFPATVRSARDRIEAEATVRFEQSAFGIEPYSAAFGAVKNRDEVELTVILVATRDPG
jgi:polyisoprenoid-binding protein YceI